MSRSDALAFVKKVTRDASLRDRVRSADEAAAIQAAEEHGLQIEPGEIAEVLADVFRKVASELGDAELEAVSGGLALAEIGDRLQRHAVTDELWQWVQDIGVLGKGPIPTL